MRYRRRQRISLVPREAADFPCKGSNWPEFFPVRGKNSLFCELGNFRHNLLNLLASQRLKTLHSGPFLQNSLFFSLLAGNLTWETRSPWTACTAS